MNYDLAKQLKNAGFPDRYTKDCKCIPVLSLSNLIEACGDDFSALHKMSSGWLVDAKYKTAIGQTPEEAVAKLWLALHT